MELEFRSCVDDAWYQVRIETEGVGGDRLRVKFVGFSDDHDEFYDADELTSFRDVEEFRSRFRPMSIQVQDWECGKVVKGTLVCAAISISPDDCRFYDAVVDRVVREEHLLVKGKKECSCSFILSWRHGPKAQSLTAQTLENICSVQTLPVGELDLLLTSFLETAKKKIEAILSSIFKVPHEAAHHSEPCTPHCREELSISKLLNQDTSFSGRPSSHSWSRKEMICSPSEKTEHDMDIGGTPYMLLVENLEKGISPFSIMEFIHQQVTISCQASVWPSKLSKAYTRGTIVVDSKSNLDKLSNFLENPDHLIISSKGRPWVMTEKSALHETARASIRSFMLMSQTILQNRSPTTSHALKVAISGTKEYETAKLMKDLFLEFVKHQGRLHQRLLLVEGRISHLSDAVRRNLLGTSSSTRSHNLLLQLKLVEAIKQAGNVKRFLPSEFGLDPARMGHALEPGRVTFDQKMAVRKAIEDAKIPFTYVCGTCFASYFAGNLSQMGTLVPPKDEVLIYGDGNTKDDVASYTIKTIDDPRTLNKTLYLLPPENLLTQRQLVEIWENLIGKKLEKNSLSKEDLLASMKGMEYAGQVGAGHFYHIFYEGSLTNFEIGEEGEEASKLYPKVKYTRIDEYLKIYA